MKQSEEERLANRRRSSRECQKKRRMKARAEGMCIICCIRKPRAGRLTCEVCGIRRKE